MAMQCGTTAETGSRVTDDIIRQIDEAVRANLCACGCGQQIPARGPSPDFVSEKHQQAWAFANRPACPAGTWYRRLTRDDGTAAYVPIDGDRNDPDETPMARVVRETSSLRRAIDKIMGKSR